MAKKSSPIDVSAVAELARLELSKEEELTFGKQFVEVLTYFESIKGAVKSKSQKVKTFHGKTPEVEGSQTSGVEDTPEVIPRSDEAKDSLSREEALQNAPAVENGYIKVKAVFEEDGR